MAGSPSRGEDVHVPSALDDGEDSECVHEACLRACVNGVGQHSAWDCAMNGTRLLGVRKVRPGPDHPPCRVALVCRHNARMKRALESRSPSPVAQRRR